MTLGLMKSWCDMDYEKLENGLGYWLRERKFYTESLWHLRRLLEMPPPDDKKKKREIVEITIETDSCPPIYVHNCLHWNITKQFIACVIKEYEAKLADRETKIKEFLSECYEESKKSKENEKK